MRASNNGDLGTGREQDNERGGFSQTTIGGQSMIEFPNYSRSYDQTRRAVRFWGHDSALETTFFIDEGALKQLQPGIRSDESSFLNVFDWNRDVICAAAAKIYVRGSRGSYDLTAANFERICLSSWLA